MPSHTPSERRKHQSHNSHKKEVNLGHLKILQSVNNPPKPKGAPSADKPEKDIN